MKLLNDNNLSFKLVKPLKEFFPGTEHVSNSVGIKSHDLHIWNYAKSNDFTIITKDNDFDERSQLEGCPPKLIHLICGNKTTLEILELLLIHKNDILSFGKSDPENCILKIS